MLPLASLVVSLGNIVVSPGLFREELKNQLILNFYFLKEILE